MLLTFVVLQFIYLPTERKIMEDTVRKNVEAKKRLVYVPISGTKPNTFYAWLEVLLCMHDIVVVYTLDGVSSRAISFLKGYSLRYHIVMGGIDPIGDVDQKDKIVIYSHFVLPENRNPSLVTALVLMVYDEDDGLVKHTAYSTHPQLEVGGFPRCKTNAKEE